MVGKREVTGRLRRSLAVLGILVGLGAPGIGRLGATVQAPELPPVFNQLIGQWRGTGTLMGRGAEFEMDWTLVLNGRFVHLRFANAFTSDQPSGDAMPVLAASAYYRPNSPAAGSAVGTWFDTRGVMLPLSAMVSATELVTLWGDDRSTERGRTTYRILGPDRAEVIDEVVRDGSYAPFGEASYTRAATLPIVHLPATEQ